MKKFAPPLRPAVESHAPSRPADSRHLRRAAGVDWSAFRFIDLFAGIGGIRLGLESAGGQCVFSSEWDEAAQETYAANFGERPAGDIRAVEAEAVPPHDLLAAGFPCQAFSIIGSRRGFGDTRGTLFFEIERLLAYHRPAAVLLENVRQFRTHDAGRTYRVVIEHLAELGYHTHTAILNALHYGVPQLRQRTFIVGTLLPVPFAFPAADHVLPDLAPILEPDDDVSPALWASDYIVQRRLHRLRQQGVEPFYPSMWHENKGGHIGMHPFSCALRHNASYNYLLVNGNRRPTGRECLRLQGFPDAFRIAVEHRHVRAQAGNSVAVPLVRRVVNRLTYALSNISKGESVPVAAQNLLVYG